MKNFKVDAIDLSSGKMMTLPSIKEARSYASTVVVQDGNKEVLYLIGGWGTHGFKSSVEMFVVTSNIEY